VFQDSFDLRHFVPVLDQLVIDTSESATFYIRDGDDQVCLFRADGSNVVRDYSVRRIAPHFEQECGQRDPVAIRWRIAGALVARCDGAGIGG
jgi:hypothetical protein